MTPELWLVSGVVAAAVAYLGWTAWRTIAGARKGCGSGCGKCGTVAEQPAAKGRVGLPQI